MMVPLKRLLPFIYVLSIWNMGYARGCADQQALINGLCCDRCPPGNHVEEFCTQHKPTVCSPCGEGFFSNHSTVFAKCEECQSCQHEYAEKCTATTNAKCSCLSGFLCSDNVCSTCEENKCVTGEKVYRTDVSTGRSLIKYSYQCKPICPDNAYFDVKVNNCNQRTQCKAFGFAELFPGNKTHDSVCDAPAVMNSSGGDSVHIILGISLVLLSLVSLLILSTACIKSRRKHRANNNPVLMVSNQTTDFHLSKEESGIQLIIQDSNSSDELHLGK
ncbi:tumor necrosis factor receptor superfamily member 3 isoform X1 [Scophthalmus maximus]|uniref:TNFR-Cys domain-containing protein n=1 Tax=Scophthalmus maximus TaxID=52904 RepID=A0A8D3B2C1_SCOMX|nr:tumor necrosis factor receptor superfamily member 3 isoform X1 [Scophthalmus maximus]